MTALKFTEKIDHCSGLDGRNLCLPRHVLFSCVTSEATQCTTCIRPPVRGKEAREGWDKVDSIRPLHLAGKLERLTEVFDHAHVVPQPAECEARHGHGALQSVGRRMSPLLVCEGGQEAVLGLHDVLAGVVQHEAARPVRVLGLALGYAALAEQSCLLVSNYSKNLDTFQRSSGNSSKV